MVPEFLLKLSLSSGPEVIKKNQNLEKLIKVDKMLSEIKQMTLKVKDWYSHHSEYL